MNNMIDIRLMGFEENNPIWKYILLNVMIEKTINKMMENTEYVYECNVM
jgi:hypothetical protein